MALTNHTQNAVISLCLHDKSSPVSVVFASSALFNAVSPSRSIQFPFWKGGKSDLFMNVICVPFFLSSLSKLSSVSVVFDFNASLNAVAPVSSILLTVDEKGKKRVNC